MKFIFTFLTVIIFNSSYSQINFEKYFIDKTLRFDYSIAGNSEATNIYFKQLKEEPFWGGSTINLIDKFNLGDYRILVFNAEDNKLIYSRGFSSIYIEWVFTEEAKHTDRSFYESVVMPFPKNSVIIKIQQRDPQNIFHTLFTKKVDPKSYFILKDKQTKYASQKVHYSGNHHKKLDIVIIPDGYTKDEMDKFHSDCNRFVKYFFEVEPFKSNKNKVNFWSVDAISEESGADIPGDGIWRNTVLNSHFYTFDSERYLTTQDIKTVRDIAAYTPYDQIYILVNTDKYGGGGIYNYYNLCSADHPSAAQVFTHEFGHAFAALADEYAYDEGTADQLYDMTVEPWQVNITNLVDFESKWKNLVEVGTPIPTPNTKEYKNTVGAYEGAGYVKKGLYRPTPDCKMRSNNTNDFCPVCYKAVLDMLLFYAE